MAQFYFMLTFYLLSYISAIIMYSMQYDLNYEMFEVSVFEAVLNVKCLLDKLLMKFISYIIAL